MLRKLFADGLSASQIAAELGGFENTGDGGRNAVIGKIHRLGLGGRVSVAKGGRPPQKQISRPPVAEPPAPEEEPIPLTLLPAPGTRRVSLVELNEDTCRWPVGDPQSPDFYFCGAPPLTGLPYCGFHCRVAYQPASDRRRGSGRSNQQES